MQQGEQSKILSRDRLEEIRDAGGEELLEEVLFEYRSDLDRLPTAMAAAWRAGDGGELRRLAHGLKGASANLGAEALAAHCAAIERSAQAGGPYLEILVTDLTPQVEALLPHLAFYLDPSGSR
ncbi:MAG: Hpt domain-containing protein [Acidobacteriota bacterium]